MSACVLLALAVALDWPRSITAVIAVPMLSAATYLRVLYQPPSSGPGMVADFMDDIRRRPPHKDS